MLFIFNDPMLPHRDTALDAHAMANQFARHLSAVCPSLEWEVVRCAIEKVYYRQGHHCGVLYRVTLRHPAGSEADEWFFGRLCPEGRGFNQLERAVSAAKHFYVAHDFLRYLPPISFWPDLNMIVWVFPQDPKIAALPYLVDPGFVRQQIKTNLSHLREALGNGIDGGSEAWWHCTEIRYDRVKYMPGKRCVLRFHINMAGPAGESRQVNFYSKSYNDAWSRYHFDMLKSVYEQLAARAPIVNIPKPLLHLDGFNTFWQEEWPGQPLIEVMEEQNWEELFPRIAEVVAAMHRSRSNGFRPGPDPDEVMNTAEEDGTKFAYMLPQYQRSIMPALERLRKEKSALELQNIPAAPIHGACRVEQMLMRGAELALVDFDAVAMGDPHYDVAEFIASLQYLELSRGLSRQRLARAAKLFYESYAALVPWSCDRRRIGWYARAFLISKMFSSIKNLDFQALQRLEVDGQEIMGGWLESIMQN
ncbi:aminoglycoside phosphotransferase family protein [candidate division KSB1 bacterium]|nr:aminoglycoside phosphotransferase family protein [candidate division KSB1 bacterium]